MSADNQTVSAAEMQEEWQEIQQAQENPALFRPLYNRYYEPIFRFIFKRTADQSISADLSSRTFLKAMEKLSAYRFQGVPFSAWLFRIASNEVAQHYRNTNKNRVVAIEDTGVADIAEELDTENSEQLRQLLLQSLDQLKPSDLEIIELRFFEQRPFKEISEILNITESNAKVRTYRVLDRLKKIMRQ